MISNKDELLTRLKAAHYEFQLHEHPPVFTVDEAVKYCAHIPGSHVKNLFIRDKKKTNYWLVTVKEDKRVDLLALGNQLNAGRLSFASHADLVAMLGVQPGSVTPFAILNDQARRVNLLLDKDLLLTKLINIHPMENIATLSMLLSDLLRFIESNRQGKVDFINIPIITS